MNKILEVLEKATDLIRNGWIQQITAKTATGDTVSLYNINATKFCLLGALTRATRDKANESQTILLRAKKIITDILKDRYGKSICLSHWNDATSTGKEDVVQLLEEAKEGLNVDITQNGDDV